MASKQSMVVNKVNVLMPSLWLHVDKEQKIQSLPLFSISFLAIFDDEYSSLETN